MLRGIYSEKIGLSAARLEQLQNLELDNGPRSCDVCQKVGLSSVNIELVRVGH